MRQIKFLALCCVWVFTLLPSCDGEDPIGSRTCGNGTVEAGESCDGANLRGYTCVDLGYAAGTLGCADDCGDFDFSGCDEPVGPVCGNNSAQGAEVCDGSDLRGKTCVTQGWDGGILRCNAGCGGYDTTGCWFNNSGSCPYVYLPDGHGAWRYHGDLSGSTLAAGVPVFRPEFYGENLYDLGVLPVIDGGHPLRLREVIAETSYVDRLRLVLVDVPAGTRPFTTWSYTSQLGHVSPAGFVTARALRAPVSATGEDGADVLAAVQAADGVPLPVKPSGLSRVVLDFGRLARPEHAKLIVTAWGVYDDFRRLQKPPYSSGTVIETRDGAGNWVVRKVAGKAAGDSKTWAIPLAGVLTGDDTRIRLTLAHNPSVLDVLDAVALDDSAPVRPTLAFLAPVSAELVHGGATHVSQSTLERRIQATDERRPVRREALMTGLATRFGDVRALLDQAEDRFVVMVHGDELDLRFSAPAPRPGFSRFAFLSAHVWYQLRQHPFGPASGTIEPLPFAGMKTYPYAASSWPHRGDAGYDAYLKMWNTRRITVN